MNRKGMVSFAEAPLGGHVQEQTPKSHEIPACSDLLAPSFTALGRFQKQRPWPANGPLWPSTLAYSFCRTENQSQGGRWLLWGHPAVVAESRLKPGATLFHTPAVAILACTHPQLGQEAHPSQDSKSQGKQEGWQNPVDSSGVGCRFSTIQSIQCRLFSLKSSTLTPTVT